MAHYRNLLLKLTGVNKIISDLKGKVAVVTGSTRGIGKATARSLAKAGAMAFISGRDKTFLEDMVAEFRKEGLNACGFVGDVSDEKIVQPFIGSVLERYGQIDILVNNAGGAEVRFLEDINVAAWDASINHNLKSAFLMSREVVPVMKKQSNGKIVNVASVAGIAGKVGGIHYSAAKGGVIALTKALAREVGKYNICVNAVAPGLIETELSHKNYTTAFFENTAKRTPLGRVGRPEDIAGVILFLASPLAD